MERKTLNRILAENLDRLMRDRGLSNMKLGKMAKIAPNTVGNYLKHLDPAEHVVTSKGKEISATLHIVQRLAEALDVDATYLLTDKDDAAYRAQLLDEVLRRPAPASSKRLRQAA